MSAVTAAPAVLRLRTRRRLDLSLSWTRAMFAALLVLTGLLYLAGLSRNGWANDFYAAAVQAGTRSWKAFFFGSFDSSSFITVDKTPASLWVMELSARIFGFSQWSMLVPQALEGVGSVALLYLTVRRWAGPVAGLTAGLVLALTPVSALMFRFNNPDALLVLLLVAAAYVLVRALETGRGWWLFGCGLLLGFGFLAKMLQAFLVLPGFALVYLWAGPPRLGRRLWHVVVMGTGVIVGAGWWVLAVALTPAADRPYVGGSTNDSILQLAFGYNGLGRLTGNETGSVGGRGGPGGGWGGAASVLRLFRPEFGGQISWLLPAALISLVVLLWVSRRRPRTDRVRAAALLWGSWIVVTGLVFSYMNGIIHSYYTVALAPGIAALTGIGAGLLWETERWRFSRGRDAVSAGWPTWAGRVVAAVAVIVTGVWSFVLLDRTPQWLPWLRWAVLVASVLGAVALVLVPYLLAWAVSSAARVTSSGRAALIAVPVTLVLLAGLAGPAAYAVQTAASAHTGALPSAGPDGGGAGAGFPGGGFGGVGRFPRATGARGQGFPAGGTIPGARSVPGTGSVPGGGTLPGGGAFPGGNFRSGQGFPAAGGRGGGFSRGGFGGGLGGDTQVSGALTTLLKKNASQYTWVAATEGSQEAAPLQLATGEAVMAIGGFNGTDPWPTLTWFQEAVAKHEIHYYLGRNSQSFGGSSGSSAITAWVAAHYKSTTVGGVTVYDLTRPK